VNQWKPVRTGILRQGKGEDRTERVFAGETLSVVLQSASVSDACRRSGSSTSLYLCSSEIHCRALYRICRRFGHNVRLLRIFVLVIAALTGLFIAGARDIFGGTFQLPSFDWILGRSYTPVPVEVKEENHRTRRSDTFGDR